MKPASAQLVFDLALRPALDAEDFYVGAANQTAIDMIDRWPDWPHWAVFLHGPASSGKSHIGNVWRFRSHAAKVAAGGLSEAHVADLRGHGALLVENVDAGINDERMLFHLLNVAREHRHSILLTSRLAPGELAVALPDLRSRLRALPVVAITAPDDALLKALLVKHLADRQLVVEPAVVDYIAARIERSMQAAHAAVVEIDRRALAEKRRVTRALAADVLRHCGAADDDCEEQPNPDEPWTSPRT